MTGTFSNVQTVTARKAHRCEECHREIAVGESYSRQTGSYDGDFYSSACCDLCARLWVAAWHRFDWCDPEETCSWGDLRSTFRDDGEADPEAWLLVWEAERAAAKARKEAPPWLPEDLTAALAATAQDSAQ